MSTEPMAKYPNLWRRSGRYYVRMRVPVDLVQKLGKTHLAVSLHTSDRKTAISRLRIEQAKIERQFLALRGREQSGTSPQAALGSGALQRLSKQDIEHIVVSWFRRSRPTLHPVALADPGGSDEEPKWEEIESEVSQNLAALQSADPARYRDHVVAVADRILREAGALLPDESGSAIIRRAAAPEVDRDNPKYAYLLALVRRGLIHHGARDHAALSGRPEQHGDPLFETDQPLRALGREFTLSGLVSAFERDPARGGASRKLSADYEMTFRVLRETLKEDKPVSEITRADCRRVLDLLLRLPTNATKRFPALSLSAAADEAERSKLPTITARTINGHLSRTSSTFKWAIREGHLETNPMEGLSVREDVVGRREPFSTDQLKRIFAAPLFTGCRNDENGYAEPGPNHPRRARFWVPLLSLFHGLRLNEACQLGTEDVTERDGVPVLLIRPGDSNQRIKSKAGTRLVPIHPEVIRIGFLNFVAQQKSANAVRLFPELKLDARGYHSDAFQKWFSRFLVSCGATKKGTTFHSFRHGWADRAREAHIPQDRRKALGGWAETGIDARYGFGFPTTMLAEDIARIRYPGLDLSALLPRKPPVRHRSRVVVPS